MNRDDRQPSPVQAQFEKEQSQNTRDSWFMNRRLRDPGACPEPAEGSGGVACPPLEEEANSGLTAGAAYSIMLLYFW